MTGVVTSIVVGGIFGLALASPPGPMNAIIATESVNRGWSAGVIAGLGALTADLVFFGLAYLGLVTVVESVAGLRRLMVGVGGVLMLYFAVDAAREARRSTWHPDEETAQRGFWKAFALAITNPYQILFWLTVGVGLLRPGTVDVLATLPMIGESLAGQLVIETGSAALVVGLFFGITVWVTMFPASLVFADQRHERTGAIVAYGSAFVLAAFGGWFLLESLAWIR